MSSISLNSTIAGLDLAGLPQTLERKAEPKIYDELGIDPVVLPSQGKESGIAAVAKRALSWLNGLYIKIVPASIRTNLRVIKLGIKHSIKFILSVYKIIRSALSTLRLASEGVMRGLHRMNKYLKIVRKLRVISTFAAIPQLARSVKTVYNLGKAILKRDKERVVEKSFKVADSVGDLLEVAETVIYSVQQFGAVTSTAVELASTYLLGIGAIFSLGAVALHSKFTYDSYKFKKLMEATQQPIDKGNYLRMVDFINRNSEKQIPREYELKRGPVVKCVLKEICEHQKGLREEEKLELAAIVNELKEHDRKNFKALIDFIDGQSDKTIKRQFGLKNRKEVKNRLKTLYEANKSLTSKENYNNMNHVRDSLFNRVKHKGLSHTMRAATGVISAIGIAFLVLCPPLAVVGFSLLAVSAVISISILIADEVSKHRFKKLLRELAPDEKLPWDWGGKEVFKKEMKKGGAFEKLENFQDKMASSS